MKAFVLTLLSFIGLFSVLPAQEKPKVMVMEIKAEIDPPMLRYVRLALEHAEKIKADYVIVEMDTYGGVLTDAKEIVDLIMDFKKPIWVYINSDAASAGALYPLAIYLVSGEFSSLAQGVYQYQPQGHALRRVADGDQRAALAAASLGQHWMSEGAAAIVVAAAYERTTGKCGQRGIRYVYMEAGHAAQNISLQAGAESGDRGRRGFR